MSGLIGSALPLDGGRGYVITTVVQCGTAIQAAAVKRAVDIALGQVVPAAYAVTPEMAAAMQRDQHHAIEAPMPPHEPAVDPEQDDDEGAPGEPPRCKTGGCEG